MMSRRLTLSGSKGCRTMYRRALDRKQYIHMTPRFQQHEPRLKEIITEATSRSSSKWEILAEMASVANYAPKDVMVLIVAGERQDALKAFTCNPSSSRIFHASLFMQKISEAQKVAALSGLFLGA